MSRSTLMLAILLISASSMAAPNVNDLTTCRSIASAEQRLACYDAIILPSSDASPKQKLATATEAQPIAPNKTRFSELFGFEEKEIAKQIPDRMDVEVIESALVHGKRVFRLSNGQVWRQTDNKRFIYNPDNGPAYIERGALSSFFFSQRDTNSRIRVRRVE